MMVTIPPIEKSGQLWVRTPRTPNLLISADIEHARQDYVRSSGIRQAQEQKDSQPARLTQGGEGNSYEEILAGYPWLERDDIRACLEYAHRLVGHERIEPFSIEVGA